MSKIICEVCGTAYPDTAEQCPICGTVRGDLGQVLPDASGDVNTARETGHTPVRGGRFSKANVKKRNRASGQKSSQASHSASSGKTKPKKESGGRRRRNNVPLMITALVLLLAIVAMAVFIYFRFFRPIEQRNDPTTTLAATEPTVGGPTEPEPTTVPCTALKLQDTRIDLEAKGRAWLLEVQVEPADTTDTLSFASSDTTVATVTAEGRVTAIGPGQATITVTCGTFSTQCRVVCEFAEETAAPITPPTEEEPTTEPTTPTDPAVTFTLTPDDFTLFSKGETYRFVISGISSSQVTWSSDDPTVASISVNGTVTAEGPGMTVVRGTYNGQTASAIVRCSFEDEGTEGTEPSGTTAPTDPSETTAPAEETFSISHSDVSIDVGESFTLTLNGSNGTVASVTWTAADGSVCSVSGNTITGLATGITTVSATYNGQTYSCIVRVR